ncbi:heme o synthase [Haladaptatus sp. DYSN1]|uniref:heme o synthase n=1 Tax=unclassified Haladaptatus TaxID=2622732 RepID=UPI00240660DE|nr:heme o synthase [Haladaptatus sp. DYSN1]
MGVYLLVVVGATASLTDAAAACSGWPVCGGGGFDLSDPAIVVALGHRLVAALVGLLVLLAVVRGLRGAASRRVKLVLTAVTALYPAQIGLGALVATTGATASLPTAHLLVGMAIFTGLVVALAWTLEEETAQFSNEPHEGEEPEPAQAPDHVTPLKERPLAARAKATIWAYFQLMKPRLMWLLALVAAAGMALASGPGLSIRTVVLTLTGGVLSIGASGTFNHVLERDIDQKMERTSKRPLATHQVPVRNALIFGFALTGISLWVFAQVNLLVAALGLTAILFYSVIYTLVLKPNTVQNTVLGGAAGALPALIGWAAVTGDIGLPGLALAGVIFLWTPAHFYNLALAYKDDYARGGFPMMPVVRGDALTRKHILWYLAATLVGASILGTVTTLGWLFAFTTVALGGVFLWAVVKLHRERTTDAAFRAFHASNAYLGMLLLAIIVDALVL